MRINFIYNSHFIYFFSMNTPISNYMVSSPLIFVILLTGCASLSGNNSTAERYLACPENSVWAGALETLRPYPVIEKNQEKGLIETDWREQPVQGRPYGLFGRDGLGDKERSRLTLSLKPIQSGVVHIELTERRQHWGFRGGAQIYQWYPVEPSQAELNSLINQLTARLDKEGCLVES